MSQKLAHHYTVSWVLHLRVREQDYIIIPPREFSILSSSIIMELTMEGEGLKFGGLDRIISSPVNTVAE